VQSASVYFIIFFAVAALGQVSDSSVTKCLAKTAGFISIISAANFAFYGEGVSFGVASIQN
jgi:hypothetical protein